MRGIVRRWEGELDQLKQDNDFILYISVAKKGEDEEKNPNARARDVKPNKSKMVDLRTAPDARVHIPVSGLYCIAFARPLIHVLMDVELELVSV